MGSEKEKPEISGDGNVISHLAPQLKLEIRHQSAQESDYKDLMSSYVKLREQAIYDLVVHFGGEFDEQLEKFATDTDKFIKTMEKYHEKTLEHSGALLGGSNKLNEILLYAVQDVKEVNAAIGKAVDAMFIQMDKQNYDIDLEPVRKALQYSTKNTEDIISAMFINTFKESERRGLTEPGKFYS